MTSNSKHHKNTPYGAYYKTDVPPHDPELTHTDRGTPMGEYLRRHWQPICLSEQLTDVPHALRIMGEDLVAFRDGAGRIGLLQRHCCHRGTSLEFGIIQPQGIRCCLHGWVFDVDGTVMETPCEPAGSRLKETVCQGAYPAFERDGLVFAYMGPPEDKPLFPEFDTYHRPHDNKLVALSAHYECNWLQVMENIMDHDHVKILHNPRMISVGGSDETGATDYAAPMGFTDEAAVDYYPTRDGRGVCFVASRRNADNETVWVRIVEVIFPNHLQIGSTFPSARRERRSQTVWTRWHVPIDDTNMLVIGWRHFNDEVDPDRCGREKDCGLEKLDFLEGVTGHRPYEEAQRAPGDYEAMIGLRPIAVHGLENPGASDKGVYLTRKLLREILAGKAPAHASLEVNDTANNRLHTYTQDSVLYAPLEEGQDDIKLMRALGRKVLDLMAEADSVPSAEREAYIRARMDEMDGDR